MYCSARFRNIVACVLVTVPRIFVGETAASAQSSIPDELLTAAERSNFESTSTYDDVRSLIQRLDARAAAVHATTFGMSHEGRELPLLIIAEPPLSSAADVRESDKLKVFVQANIHAGEVCGKEAVLMLARDACLDASSLPLQHVVVLLAPIYNADGNERVSPSNRPDQNGPLRGMGIRENAQGLDLNRDHTKLESPEARALVTLLNDYDPDIVIDTHATNGSRHAYTITYDGPRHPATPGRLTEFARDTMLPEVGRRLHTETGYRAFYYGNFSRGHQRWETYPATPRYNAHYVGLRGHLAILSEAYAYAPFRDRVLATRAFVREVIRYAAEHRDELESVIDEARSVAATEPSLASSLAIPIASRMAAGPRPFTVLGDAPNSQTTPAVTVSPGSTSPSPTTKEYQLPVFQWTDVTKSVEKPHAYLIPKDHTAVIRNLLLHGIELAELRETLTLPVESYKLTDWKFASDTFQNHRNVSVRAESVLQEVTVSAGTLVARTNQRLAPLLVNLLEPEAEDSLLTWNFFDGLQPSHDKILDSVNYPVLRLLVDLPLLTSNVKRPSVEAREGGKKPLSFDALFGDKPVNLSGMAAGSVTWLPNGDEFVQWRDSQPWAVHAESGKLRPIWEVEAVAETLADLAGTTPGEARKALEMSPFHGASTVVFDASHQHAVVHYQGDLYYLDLEGGGSRRLSDSPEDEELATISPDGKWVGFVRKFTLFVVDMASGQERAVSPPGTRLVRYGKADWVYFEEVYNRSWQAYRWSPDSKRLAFMEFDDRPVNEFTVLQHLTPRGNVERERYPKSGDPIPRVRLGMVAVTGGPVRWVNLADYSEDNRIVTRYGWLPDSERLYVLMQDRAQKWLDYCHAQSGDGSLKRLFRERSNYWVADPESPHYLQDGSFLLCSERSGWRHVYHFEPDGALRRQITNGDWEVRTLQLLDEREDWLYFQGTRDSHRAEQLYRVRLAGGEPERLTAPSASHDSTVAPRTQRFVDAFSSLTQPTQVEIRTSDGTLTRILDSNPVRDLDDYELLPVEEFEIPLADGYHLPCTMIRPKNFDRSQKYPLWLMTYGGPHAPTVNSSWNGGRGWGQLLAAEGILAFQCDPRSASGQGAVSTRTAYQQLGVQETKDLEEALKWLISQGYVDPERIGMSGFSYGGYLTSYVMTHSQILSAGIAGAPVTDWRNYDAFYTERYMNTPQENPDGYQKASVLEAAKQLHGRLLLIHGSADDNVHLQNSFQLAHRLQEEEIPFEMMIYPTSRHGILGEHFQRLQWDFIRRTMLARP